MSLKWLLDKLEKFKEYTAIVWKGQEYSYSDLSDRTDFWINELKNQGIDDLNVICLEGDYSLNSCALLLALIEKNKIVVPVTKAVEAQKSEFLQIAEAQAEIAFDSQDSWNIKKTKVNVTNVTTQKLIHLNYPGLVLFSSGSTGKPKGALHNFSKILEKFKEPRHKMKTLNFLLFDHIGGINTLFYTLSNGGTVVTTSSRDPEKICRLVEMYQIELLPTTPTFLNLLLISDAHRNYDLSSLKLITYGTEVMSESVLNKLAGIFPKARLLQTYGLSELGILRSKSKSSDSLWVKVGGDGFETKIVDDILWIRADSAMVGYLNAPDPFTDDGWFITGDVVEDDGDYIRILGRNSDLINVGGEKVYPAEVENLILMMEGVEDVAVCAEPNPILGNIVRADVKLKSGEDLKQFKKRMRSFCRKKIEEYKIPKRIILVTERMYGERFKKMRPRME